MRSISVTLPENTEPWLVSFEERYGRLLRSFQEKKIRILGIYDAPNTSSFRYRLYNLEQAMRNDPEICFLYFYRYELKELMPLIPRIDVMLYSRCQWTLEIQQSMDIAKSNRVPVVFDVDDMLFNLSDLQLITNTLNVHLEEEFEYNFWTNMIGRTYMSAVNADCYIATNPYLKKKMEDFFGKPGYVIENSLNDEQTAISEAVCAAKHKAPDDGRFVIGYFSGTPSHINDFKTIQSELIRLLDDYPDMILKVVGFMDFPPEMQRLIQQGRIEFHPLVNFIELQQLMGEVDVSIVPLVENDFTNCKSELKFFEAAIVETVTCAAPIYTYANSIQHGRTGFLCRQGEWYKTIASIYRKEVDTEKMINEAKEYCLNRYYGENFKESVRSVFKSILKKRAAR